MPALITHHLFGESVAPALKNHLTSQEDVLAFLLGNQGPDPLFFRFMLPVPSVIKRTSRLGSLMHRTQMSAFFDALREAIVSVPASDQSTARAWALGMLGHYALDRRAHPYVYARQYEITRAHVGLDQAGSQVHALIESELDSFMLWIERGATVEERPPVNTLNHTDHIDRVAGSLLSQVVYAVWGQHIDAKLYGKCVDDMRSVYTFIEPLGSRGSLALGRLEQLIRHDHSLLSSLAHPVVETDECIWSNMGHTEWHDVMTGEPSHDSFLDLFTLAEQEYPDLMKLFLDGAPGELITQHLDYGGIYREDEQVAVVLPTQ